MARDHPELVAQGLELKKAGNQVMTVVGGREIHPINVRVGGFYRAPSRRELAALVEPLERAREIALETVRLAATLPAPTSSSTTSWSRSTRTASTRSSAAGSSPPAVATSRRASSTSTSSRSTSSARTRCTPGSSDGTTYLAGPIARFNLNFDRARRWRRRPRRRSARPAVAQSRSAASSCRSVELVHACDEALRLIEAYEPPERPFVDVEPRASVGYGATEAPRGTALAPLRARRRGTILDARIVPPTSQNQRAIEHDLRWFVERYADLPDEELGLRCEQAIRNHDPCISCATHFLQLEVERR